MRPPKLRLSRSICRRVMAFRIFSNKDRPPFWILIILIFDYVTVIMVLICCCVPNFNKISSRVRPPDSHNCWMYNAPLLGNGCCHGNRITGDMSGTWWNATTQVSSKSVHWPANYSVSKILQYGGRPLSWIWILLFWTTHEVDYVVRFPCQNLVSIRYSPPEILQFYNCAILAGKCLTTPPFRGFLNSVIFVGGHSNPQKAHPWVTTRHLSHKWLKSVQGFDLGGVARKKIITRTGQDRTTKKSQKRNISHICRKAPRKAIAIKFCKGVDVHDVVTWAKVDL